MQTKNKCPTCDSTVGSAFMETIYWRGESRKVCMQCYLLTLIAERLGRIEDGQLRQPQIQMPQRVIPPRGFGSHNTDQVKQTRAGQEAYKDNKEVDKEKKQEDS